MMVVRQAVRAAMTIVLPPSQWLVRGRCPLLPGQPPQISLTFDDGPHPEHTPAVLEALDRWRLTATFFVVGREAERHPALMQRLVAAGHAVGNHTFTHSEPRTITAARWLDEIERTDRVLETWLGAHTPWVRPPKGELTWSKFAGVWRQQRTVALWNVDPRDYRMTSPSDALAWAKTYSPRHGDIVLLHDRFPHAAAIVHALGDLGVFDRVRCVRLEHWTDPDRQRLAAARSHRAQTQDATGSP